MTEEQVFLAALDLPDETARAAYLADACGNDTGLRRQVEALLANHFRSGEFLDVPAAEQIEIGGCADVSVTIQSESMSAKTSQDDESDDLTFLTPSTRPGSLGRLGHYELLQMLGRGGFGIVFRAFDDVLQRVVAIKVMAPQLAATSPARKRFLREARSSAQVRHENVVQVYGVEEQPLPYLAMEFIPGETLQQRLDRTGPLDVPETLRIGRQIAEGLAAAHAMDLIHRDIKPGNVLLEGGQHKVKITDFGLARAADDASMTQSGMIAGTPMYMAPEQALGQTLDQRADLFSLGSVLYQTLAGRPPFRANTTVAVLKRVAEDTPRPIREVIPETPQWLCDIISKLHAKNPGERYQSAREIADVLANCESQLKEHSRLKDLSLIPRAKTQPAGWWKWAAVSALVLPLLAIALYAVIRPASQRKVAKNGTGEPPTPNQVAKQGVPESDGWVQLFNGKDLTGWIPSEPDKWKVADGILVGKARGHLKSNQSYQDFHLHAKVRYNRAALGTLAFRGARAPNGQPIAHGEVSFGNNAAGKTGSAHLWYNPNPENVADFAQELVPADTWFDLDIIVRGKEVVAKVNGTTTARITPDRLPERGRISLNAYQPGSVIEFSKIEIKKLPSSALPPTFRNTIGMEFVIVPKGKSWLGGGKDKLGDKEVEIPADFYLGKYEVTQEEWEKVMAENPSHFSRTGDGKDAVKDINDADLKRFPVESVSWDQCQVFVAKLNQREKETGWLYRLPTEAEWEYACRGGPLADKANSAFDYYFAKPTNILLLEQANFGLDKGLNRTCNVGRYEANRAGLFDMHGNVWEWCDDTQKAVDGASLRVYKGGCLHDDSGHCGAASRLTDLPSHRHHALGLRLSRIPSGAPSPAVKSPPVALAPFTDADVARIAALPAAEQVEEVRKALKRLNPGFDGTLTPTIENGVVTELRFHTDEVVNIAPVRALKGLTSLDCSGSGHGKGKLSDLSPLKGVPLTTLWAGFSEVRDLMPLKDMPLTSLHLRQCRQVQDLSPLKGMKLTELSVDGTGVLDLELFKGMPLTSLDLGTTQVRDLNPVKNMPLTWLNLGDCRHVLDLEPVKGMPLTYLNINGTQVRDLEQLKGMPLKSLQIHNTGVTDLSPLKGMQLQDIRLTTKNVTQGLNILREMKSLISIGIHWERDKYWPAAEFWERYDKGEFGKAVAPFTDADVKRIAALPAAEQVEEVRKELMRRNPGLDGKVDHKIEDGVVTEFSIKTDRLTDIAPIRVWSSLRVLKLFAPKVGDADLVHLKDCKELTELWLGGLTKVSDAGLAHFKDCKNLTDLHVEATQVSDVGLAHMKDCKCLGLLDLGATQVSDAGLVHLRDFKALTQLRLGNTQVTDAGLAHLKGLPLMALWIDHTGITDLTPLQDMPLEDIRLSPKNIVKGLDILRGMKSLKTIGIAYYQAWPAAEFWERYDKGEFKE